MVWQENRLGLEIAKRPIDRLGKVKSGTKSHSMENVGLFTGIIGGCWDHRSRTFKHFARLWQSTSFRDIGFKGGPIGARSNSVSMLFLWTNRRGEREKCIVNYLRWQLRLRTVTSGQTVYNNSSLSYSNSSAWYTSLDRNCRVINLSFVLPALYSNILQPNLWKLISTESSCSTPISTRWWNLAPYVILRKITKRRIGGKVTETPKRILPVNSISPKRNRFFFFGLKQRGVIKWNSVLGGRSDDQYR